MGERERGREGEEVSERERERFMVHHSLQDIKRNSELPNVLQRMQPRCKPKRKKKALQK